MSKETFAVMLARFPGGRTEDPAVTDWAMDFWLSTHQHPRVERVERWWKIGTPIDSLRNEAVQIAKGLAVDFLVMIDSDMEPDAVDHRTPAKKKFWPRALDFLIDHWDKGPCAVAVSYCSAPPDSQLMCYIATPKDAPLKEPGSGFISRTIPDSLAVRLSGYQMMGALPTGLIAFDMRMFSKTCVNAFGETVTLQPPYFHYTWEEDPYMCHRDMANTEDLCMTRKASAIGIPMYCDWDTWAVHWKLTPVGKPAAKMVGSFTPPPTKKDTP
jgi:hypothetical protein